MTDPKKDNNNEKPTMSRAFLSRMTTPNIPPVKVQLIFWPLVLLGVASDLWTKHAVFEWLSKKPGNTVSVIDGIFQFIAVENAGAAFGIAHGQRFMLAAVSIIALIIILWLFFFSQLHYKLVYIALALFTAGICGNLYDRIFNYGRVRDFIDIVYWPGKHWPAFNIADSMLCIGVALMIITSFLTDMHGQKHDQQHK